MTVVTEIASAKINLTLDVLGRRSDGYHDLDSLIAFARDVGDTVAIDPDALPAITTGGPFAGAITGENILARAVEALAQYGVHCGSIHLDKQLPVASGIGGGSADAGALLRAARRACPARAADVPWIGIAAALGADVTACFESRPLRIVGTGSHVQPLDALPRLTAVLINPMASVPADKTARVFRALGLAPGTARAGTPTATAASLTPPAAFEDAEALVAFIRRHRNALTDAASSIVPAIADVIEAMEARPGCRVARLSGAGPTCFGLFDTMEVAEVEAAALRAAHPRWWVKPTRLC